MLIDEHYIVCKLTKMSTYQVVGWLLARWPARPLVAVDVDTPVVTLFLTELCAGGEIPLLVELFQGLDDPWLQDTFAGVVTQDFGDVAQLQLGDLLGLGGVRTGREHLGVLKGKLLHHHDLWLNLISWIRLRHNDSWLLIFSICIRVRRARPEDRIKKF